MKMLVLVPLVGLAALAPPSIAALPEDLDLIPADAQALLVVDWTQEDEDGVLAALQEQLVGKIKKPLDDLQFLTDISLEEEAELLVLARLPFEDEEGESNGVVGLLVGRFSETTRNRLDLSRELMAERDDRVLVLDESRVAFGNSKALERLRETPGMLGASLLAEYREDLEASPVWGMTTGPAFGKPAEDATESELHNWSLMATLQSVPSQLFWCRMGEEVDFRLVTHLSSASDKDLLIDEFETYRGLRWLPAKQKAFLKQIELERSGPDFSLKLQIPSEAEAVKEAKPGKLAEWDFGDAGREKKQKVDRILEAMEIEPGARVADVGSGWGFLTFRLARAVGTSGKVWSVDIEEDALDKLRDRTARASYEQVLVVKGKQRSPKLPRKTLDAVVIVNAYHEMTRYKKMLRHFRRSLLPDGRLVIVEPYDPDGRDEPREDQVKYHQIAPELVESELQNAGFEVIERVDDLVESPKQSLIVARPR